MPGEINGEIQNAEPVIEQETQIKKEGEAKRSEVENEVENRVHKNTESEFIQQTPSEDVDKTNGNGTHEEVPETPESQPVNEGSSNNDTAEHEQTKPDNETQTSQIEVEERTDQESLETPVETQSFENIEPQHEETVSENLVCDKTPEVDVCEKSSQNEVCEKPLQDEVCEKPTTAQAEVCENPATVSDEVCENSAIAPVEACEKPVEVAAPVEELTPKEVTPNVEIKVTETSIETPVEERIVIESYAEKIESTKHKQVEKEYTKEVIESEVPARIVEEVKKGFESVKKNGTPTHSEHTPPHNGVPKKGSLFTSVDEQSVKTAYEDVRNDNSETQWAVFKFEAAKIKCSATGSLFEKFQEQFDDKERAFGFIRVQTGDEMSKRQKFLFITWVGPSVSVLQRAKMSTDKSFIKNIISNFAVELQLENQSEINLKHFVNELNKAGGAHYGTGVRDN